VIRRRLALFVVTTLVAAFIAQPVAAQDQSAPPLATDSVAERLKATFPANLLGAELQVTAFDGIAVTAAAAPDDPVNELTEVAARHGASIEDFAIASAAVRDREPFVGLLAATIEGVPATDVIDDLTRLILETDDSVETTKVKVAGRDALRVESGSGLVGDDIVHVFPAGETVWYVVADPAELEAIVAELP
jgi:hypothetical protein